ncbi:hypothetical protein MKX03_027771 [Papaver bracteatum]|nr:hypothetical protein MKX03_027771 [Papaver bracteatum]
MVKRSSVIITLLMLVLLHQVLIGTSNAVFPSNSRSNWSDSSFLIADYNEEEEMLMDSEISRRFLAGAGKHISYDAIAKDAACGGGGQGKPYAGKCPDPKKANDNTGRPCSKIYHCRSGSQ